MLEGISSFQKRAEISNNIVIIGHFNPDGDAVGSICGTHHFLKGLGIDSTMILPSDYPSFLSFLDPDSTIQIFTYHKNKLIKQLAEADLIICLDFNRLSRTEEMKEAISESKAFKILVDHHPDPERESFDLCFSDTSKSSTSEFLFSLFMETPAVSGDISKLSESCLTALCAGMLSDTNNFNNSCTSDTYKMASMLSAYGIDLDKINHTIFGNYSLQRMLLMGYMLDKKMKVNLKDGYAYMVLSLDEQSKYDYGVGDSEGFVNLPLLIKEVEVSALFTQTQDYLRVSLRSKGKYSVNALSREYFNGGGHEKAAGGRLYMDIEEVADYFTKSIEEFIKKA